MQREPNRVGTHSKSVGNLFVGHLLKASHGEYLGLTRWKQRDRAAQPLGEFAGYCILVRLRRSVGQLGCFCCWRPKWASAAHPKPVNRPSRGQKSKESGPVPYFRLPRNPICLQEHVLHNVFRVVIVSHDSANRAYDQCCMAIHDLWPVIRHGVLAFPWVVIRYVANGPDRISAIPQKYRKIVRRPPYAESRKEKRGHSTFSIK